ncbi:MAG TPA: SRPBCC family protein [Planctomycetota bacterium]|nr:SRPBCC family protein [Planctomycetota bacterium]
MFKKILIVLSGLLIAFLLVVALQPSGFSVARSTTINAPPTTPFAHVNNFHHWQAWSPFEQLDPAMKRTFEGPTEGVGAIYRWIGNDQAGEGSMTVLESRPGELIRIELDFIKPMAGKAEAQFVFRNEGAGSSVSWTMLGQNSFVGKAMCMFMNMDKLVGAQFAEGLASLKRVSETAAKP